MPLRLLTRMTALPRTAEADLHIGMTLAFVAGALNAGGFLAIGFYTSHVTGMVSTLADQVVLHNSELASIAASAWIAFVSGAATTALMVNYLRRRGTSNVYAVPLMTEALLILLFGALTGTTTRYGVVSAPLAIGTLCFTMGLQNALITKISRARIRTTHLTGLTTDLGIELGKLLYWNRSRAGPSPSAVRANVNKLRVHAALIACFTLGGIAGALAFHFVGPLSAVPLSLALAAVAIAPAIRP